MLRENPDMAESVNSNYTSVMSPDERHQMYADFRKQLTKDSQVKRQTDNSDKEKTEKKSPFLSNTDIKNRKNPFLNNADMADRQTPFITEDSLPERQAEPFMTRDITAEREATFLEIPTGTESPLQFQNVEEEENTQDFTAATITFPKNNDTIITELKRNPLYFTMTARDIADKYEISYQKATDIYKALNEDASGVVREFNLPDNSTVSYLV